MIMKQYKFLSTALSLALMLIWGSCSQEEEQFSAADNGQFIINVYDAGMENGDVTSRAVTDDSYNIIFEKGDCIGLFAVRNGQVLDEFNNVKVECSESGTWISSKPLQYDEDQDDLSYYAYYPYQEGPLITLSFTDNDVFKEMAANWKPETDQSTKENYAKSDLMTSGAAVVRQEASGQYTIRLDLKHRMALSVMVAPETEYKFSDSSLNEVPYIVKDAGEMAFYTSSVNDGNMIKPYLAEDGTYRMIVKPAKSPDIIGQQGEKKYNITTSISEGKYRRFLLGGGKKNVEHELKVGDFYCADGKIVSADQDVPANCIGVVYYVGNAQPSVLYKEDAGLGATPEKDVLLIDYPDCVHGLVYAVNSSNAAEVSKFCGSSKYDYPGKAKELGLDTKYIWKTAGKTDVPEYILGYNNTILLYKFSEDAANSADDMYANLNSYIASHAVPAVTTGWYLPSVEELDIIFDNQGILDTSLEKGSYEKLWNNPAGYDTSAEDYFGYWTSTVRAKGYMVGARIDGGKFVPYTQKDTKTGKGYFRFALAF